MTQHQQPSKQTPPIPSTAQRPRPLDPILAELWAIKAKLNKQANYDVTTLIEQAQLAAKELAART
jgi:hypothetical protein